MNEIHRSEIERAIEFMYGQRTQAANLFLRNTDERVIELINRIVDYYDLAMEALRADIKQRYEPVGCAYCNGDELQGYALEIMYGKYPKIIGLSNKGIMSNGQSAFAYCPNCGRRLSTETEEDEKNESY